MISGVHLFAPWLTIDYEIPGTISTLKASANKLRDQKGKTSALFYTQVQLRELLLKIVLTTPKLKYKKLCNELFRDFSKEAPLKFAKIGPLLLLSQKTLFMQKFLTSP